MGLGWRTHGKNYAGSRQAQVQEGPTPGRRTLTESLPPVQRVRAAGAAEADPDRVKQAAADGAHGGGAMPHLDLVQRAFGPAHDLSGVRASVGGAAAAACDEMGAESYTQGETMGFRSNPDLWLTAHEATHVVQQRAGVQFGDGVGREGDAYEQQADRVADRVAAGGSAADLLGASGAAASAVPQRNIQLRVAAGAPEEKGSRKRSAPEKLTAAEKKKYLGDKAYAEGVMREAGSVQDALLAFHEQEMEAISKIGLAADILVMRYDYAYAQHEKIIKEANERAELQQKWLDFALNIAVGMATAGAAAMFAAMFAPAKNIAIWILRALVEESISQGVSTVASATVADIKTTVSAVARENKEAQRWKMVAELFREAADLVPALGKISKFALGATRVVGDCNAAAGGISLAFFTLEELDAAIKTLRASGAEEVMKTVKAGIAGGWTALQHQRRELETKVATTDAKAIEKIIWLQWVARLPSTGSAYDQLDNDVIEDYLSSMGIIGKYGELRHDSGRSTDDDDERIWQASAASKINVMEHIGMIGRLYHPRAKRAPGTILVSPDNRSVTCDDPKSTSKSGWYSVRGAIGRDSRMSRDNQEKRIEWVAELAPVEEADLDARGIDKSWKRY